MKKDYIYIADSISNISRIAVRVYQNDRLLYFVNTTAFPCDPGQPYIQQLLNSALQIGYYITPYDQYYGMIRFEDHTMILGPSYHMLPTHVQIRDYMFTLGLKDHYQSQYMELMNSITPMPLELFLHLICLINYYLTDEKCSISDLMSMNPAGQTSFFDQIPQFINSIQNQLTDTEEVHHNTYDFEQKMLSMVTAGNTRGLKEFFARVSPGQSGRVADTGLRQQKNIFVTTTTLVSRAAISGGISLEEALSISDRFIQQAEKLSSTDQLFNLQYNMIIDYASRVYAINHGRNLSAFVKRIYTYVNDHLTEELSVEQMAADLSISRSYLSAKFKTETGESLTDYITGQKIKKAMEYLKNTDRSIADISSYLNFSSQGYFQRVFKKVTGTTPKKYRDLQ